MKRYVNMLPTRYRRAKLVRRRLLAWSLVWTGVVVIYAGLWGSRHADRRALGQVVDQRREASRPVNDLIAQARDLRTQIDKLEKREALVDSLRDDRPSLTAVGLVSDGARRCDGTVRVERLLLERGQHPSRTGTAGPSRLTIEGMGLDNLAVAKFIVMLRQSHAFQNVELKSSTRSGGDLDEIRRFVLECEYQ